MKIHIPHPSFAPLHLIEISHGRKSFRKESIAKIGDAVRASLITENLSQIPHVLASVQRQVIERNGRLHVKDYWKTPSTLGFVGVIVKICMPLDGDLQRRILMELQIHPKAIMDGTKDCPKEWLQSIYKIEAFPFLPEELIAASKLIYLIAMNKLTCKDENLKELFDSFFKKKLKFIPNKKVYFALESVIYIKQKKLSGGRYSRKYGIIIPTNPKAIEEEFRATTTMISQDLHLPMIKMENDYMWHNSAETIDDLYEDAKKSLNSFKVLCEDIIKYHSGCTVSYGPENSHLLKDRASLMKKIKNKANANEDLDVDYDDYKSWFSLILP